jgi:hypothetical protein
VDARVHERLFLEACDMDGVGGSRGVAALALYLVTRPGAQGLRQTGSAWSYRPMERRGRVAPGRVPAVVSLRPSSLVCSIDSLHSASHLSDEL